MLALIRQAGAQLIRRRFCQISELTGAVSESLAHPQRARKGLKRLKPPHSKNVGGSDS